MNDELYDALIALKLSVDRQNELQEDLIASLRVLTEMVGRSIEATKELTDTLNAENDNG